MIATLKELCIQQAAEHIVEGRLKTATQKLDPHSSNLVFAEFMKFNMHKYFSKSCKTIKNLLTLTKVELYGLTLDENMCKMIHEQNIKELGLERFEYWKRNMFRMKREDREDLKLYGKIRVDICVVLESLLNRKSRRNLTKLEINGFGIRFSNGWVEKIAKLLPSLEVLNLLCLESDEKTIQSIYENFPNLRELDIQGSRITNLNGISKLSKLEVLSISEIQFDNIDELFELKNLKTLFVQGDISRGSSDVMLLYIGSGKRLPQLEHLVCSYCKITEEMLQILLVTHKTLKYIDLMGTTLRNRSQITGRGLKLFTMGTFKDCLCTAKMLIGYNASSDYLDPILVKLLTLLNENFGQICQKELSECLELMCQIMDSYSNLCNRAAEILEIMCKRAEKFSFAERQQLIFTIFNSFEKGSKRMIESRTDPIWSILSNPVILETSEGNLNKLCEYAASAFHKYSILQGCPPTSIMALLANNLEKMSTDRAKALASDLERDVLNAIRFFIAKKTDERRELQFLTTIIHKLYVIGDRSMEKECVEIFCEAISTFKNDIENQIKLVATLEKIIGCMHHEVLLDNEKVFPVLMEMFYDQYTLQQKTAINLFHSLFCKANSLVFSEEKSLEEDQELLVKDVRILLRGFEATSGDVLDGLKWILEKSESKMTKEVCEWMIEEFGREEESLFFYNFTRRFPY